MNYIKNTNKDKSMNITIRQDPGYSTYYYGYVKGHWLRSWKGLNFQSSASNDEKVLEDFIKIFYGTSYEGVNKKHHPQYFV